MKKLIALIMVLTIAAFAICGCTQKPQTGHASPTATPAANATDKPGGETVTNAPASDGSNPFGTVAPGGEVIAKTKDGMLYWDSMRVGGGTDSTVSYEVFGDYDAFAAKFSDVLRGVSGRYTAKSFTESFVVAAYVTVPTGGYTFGLERGEIEDGTVVLDLKQEGPAPGTAVTQAFETHCVLVAFNRKAYSEDIAVKLLINGKEQINGTVG